MAKKKLLRNVVILSALINLNAAAYSNDVQRFLDDIENSTERSIERSQSETDKEINDIMRSSEKAVEDAEIKGQIDEIEKATNKALENRSYFNDNSKLYAFVSLSMPYESLKQIALDTKKYNGILVLRGLKNNSFKETIIAVQELVRETRALININPEQFTQYEVSTVPTYVLDNGNYDKLSGNVTIGYFLDKVKNDGDLKASVGKV